MWKKAIAFLLVIIICASVIWFANPITPTVVSARQYKSGFSVVAEKEDETGVALDSGFVLSSETAVTLEFVKENVSLRDGGLLTITPASDGKFLLNPSEPLKQNKVYYIDIRTQSGDIVSFAFQTKRDFTVLGSLPSNMSSSVPLDTGIELYFSYPYVKNIDKYFEITPNVKGRFESNGYTTVFVPNEPLEAGTIYTVTIKKGLTAAKGAAALAEDYTFSFETSADPKSTADPYPGYLNVNSSWIEFGTTEKPVIPFDLYMNGNLDSVDVVLKVYQFKTLDDFIKAIREKEKAPSWAPYALSKSMIDTSNLSKVLEFKQSFSLKVWQPKYMMFPKTLPHGYYLIELSCDKLSSQAFLQISDISAFTISDNNNTLFWLNNLKTQDPVLNAEIYDYLTGKSQKTGGSGLVKLPNANNAGSSDNPQLVLYRVTTSDGKASLINAGYLYSYGYQPYGEGLYWRYIQTDRTLYKPSDTVEFWGYIKSRLDGSSPKEVTVELSSGGYFYPMKISSLEYFMPFLSNPLETIKLDTEGGFFKGKIDLPALDPGSYTLTVKDGDEVISSTWFRVENYIKPQYKLEIESDKKAVFTGEKINFTIKATFFDGTPVANIPLKYSIQGPNKTEHGEGITNADGMLHVAYTPSYDSSMQGECYFSLSASAQFPETGEISEYYGFRVFANDIVFSSRGEIKDNKGTVEITVNDVELETLNDDDAANDNFTGDPINGHSLSLKLYHITWERIETGNEYDAINKVVRKTYEYREKRTPAGEAVVKTGSDGKARYEFAATAKEDGYYVAEITTRDKNGRGMKGETWIYKSNYIEKLYPTDYEYYTLKTDKDSYKANETVNVKVLKNNEEPLRNMRTLFVQARNGIQYFEVKSQPEMSQPFPEAFAPNYYIEGIVFNGKGYIRTSANVIYDYNEKKINLEIKTDKDSYKPGENMTIEIKATDNNGNPIAAKVNLSMVDEALLKLSGQHIDPLGQLYSWIGSGIIRSVYYRDTILRGKAGDMVAQEALADYGSDEKMVTAPSARPAAGSADMQGEAAAVRSDFKDTALFETIALDSSGTGSYTFKLPDNITSFSLAAAAISSDLYAGSDIQSAKVSMPFFINDALSLDYLVGDKPYVGVTAYGSELKENEKVTFELMIKELPNYIRKAAARAFERVNIELPAMEEGTYTLVITAKAESGMADALSRTITVHPSFRTIETSVLKTLTTGMKISAGKSGITTLIFTDAGRGSLINSLHGLAWDYGNRIDQKLVSNYARKLLKEIIKNKGYYLDEKELNTSDYRNEDGGYGILPYAGTDLKLTALITPLLKDEADTNSLKMYFYNEILSDNKIKAPALFALAELGEPVLLDLERAIATQNLALEDYIFLGLAYEAIGDLSYATEIYNEIISPNLERKDPYIRVKVKNGDLDSSYSLTALAAVLASRINSADASKLYQYVENNYSKTRYVGVEKVLYLSDMMKKLPDTAASFEYNMGSTGKTVTVDLSNGRCEVIKVPSVNIGQFKVRKVNGNVSVLSLYTAPLAENVKNDSGITITRKYYNAATGKETTTFKPNDIVKIEITYNIDKTAIDNTYEISDYAPAGLKPLENPWNHGVKDLLGCWYRQFDGQKVTFVAGKTEEPQKPLVYYARVASPGEYIAEGTVAQGSLIKSSIVTIEDTKIVIR